MGGGIQKRIYLVEHPQGLDASQKRQRIAQDAGGYINHPDPGHWIGGGIIGSPNPRYVIAKSWLQTPSQFLPKGYLESHNEQLGDKTEEYGSSRKQGFSGGSFSDRLTEEQENEIAENIYDWWVSGKSYKQWYAEKFLQQQINFDFNDETTTSEENNGMEQG